MKAINGAGADLHARAHRTFETNRRGLATALERLSTGRRLNRAADGPAALITSENLKATLAALEAETRTLQRTDHVASTAGAALGEISGLLTEAEALVVANANDAGLSQAERNANRMQLDSIVASVNRIGSSTAFNGQRLLDGSTTLEAAGASVTIDRVHLDAVGEGVEALETLDAAREQVATTRGELGAFSRHTIGAAIDTLGVTFENLAAAESMIGDADYGQEAANLARSKLLADGSLYTMLLTRSFDDGPLKLLGG